MREKSPGRIQIRVSPPARNPVTATVTGLFLLVRFRARQSPAIWVEKSKLYSAGFVDKYTRAVRGDDKSKLVKEGGYERRQEVLLHAAEGCLLSFRGGGGTGEGGERDQ